MHLRAPVPRLAGPCKLGLIGKKKRRRRTKRKTDGEEEEKVKG